MKLLAAGFLAFNALGCVVCTLLGRYNDGDWHLVAKVQAGFTILWLVICCFVWAKERDRVRMRRGRE